MKQTNTILVTGSAGFIGFHTSKKLLDLGYQVIGVDNLNNYYDVKLKNNRNKILKSYSNYTFYKGDLQNLRLVKKIFTKHKINKVCHLAAQAGVRYSLENPHAYINSNIVAFANLIEEAKNNKIKDFIYASSSSVYGNNHKIPFAVKDNVDHPISLYAATKKSNELIAHTYHHLYKMNCVGLRFFTVYGPYGRPDMATMIFADKIINKKPIEVYNYGKMERDFTYIDDIVSGILKAIKKPQGYEIFNLGNNKPIKLTKFISLLEKNLGVRAKQKLLPLQPGDVKKTFADIKNTKQKLDWQPTTDLETGLAKTIEWYKKYYNV